jgi:hypothetical protein
MTGEVRRSYVVVVGSGRVHQRMTLDGALLSDERCNLDDAADLAPLDSIEDVEPGDLCHRCFGMALDDGQWHHLLVESSA